MNDIQKINFELRDGDNFIPLISLLKAVGIAESGSMAQDVVTAGLIRRNGEIELRKRAKIISGDIIEFENYVIHIK
ncbi:MAG: RNA-binding S4 domain-containing protein [Bacteroidales bacterium]|nr:RNA-binding S4 domain-containing protein [Bacteroidales bacterium]